MQTSISKRLLAGLLSIVMVLSLFVATPAKTEAGYTNRNVCTIELKTKDRDVNGDVVPGSFTDGVVYNHVKSDLVIDSLLLGDEDVTDIDYVTFYGISNGLYTLDADDMMYNMIHQIAIIIYPHDMYNWKDLKAVQVQLGGAASASSKNGYDLAEFEVGDGYVLVVLNTTKQPTRVAMGDIYSLKTNIAYQYYFPTSLKGFTTLHFTTGALTWMRVEGETRDANHKLTAGKVSYPTYPILGSAPNKTDKSDYYAVSTIISAEAGYDLPVNGWYEAADGRVFEITDRSKDGTTAKLTIWYIYPRLTSDFANVGVTSIELKRQINFGTGEVLVPADVIKYLPTSFDVVVNGEKKTIPMTTLKNKRAQWVIYCVSGGGLAKMPDTDKFEQTNYDVATTGVWTGANPECVYYARLEMVVSDPTAADYWDPYKVATGEDYQPIAYDLFYASAEDAYGILERYSEDRAAENADGIGGWTIEFTVNKGRAAGGTTIDVPAYMTVDAPTVNFYGYVNDGEALYTAFAVGSGATTFQMYNTENIDTWTTTNAWVTVPSDKKLPHSNPVAEKNGRVYRAFTTLGYGNFTVKSPYVYNYFNPVSIYSPELKSGSISVTVTEPEAYKQISYEVKGAAADKDLANGLDLKTEDIYLIWDGEILSGDNTGKEQFVYGEDYTAYVLIPVKPGYKLTFTPEVRINGNKAEAEIYEEDGVTYVLAAYTWKTETKPGNIIKTGAQKKKARFNLNKPFAGAPVQKTLKMTDSAARFYEFVDIEWYENGVEFEGDTFTKGKRYTAIVTLDASKGGVTEDCTEAAKMVVTEAAYMVKAVASTSTQELVITYEFPAAELPKYESANNVIIEVPNGMSKAAFYQYVAAQLYVTVNFVGGTTGLLPTDLLLTESGRIEGGYAPDPTDPAAPQTWAECVELAMLDEYPGLLGYDENSAAAQNFVLYGYTLIAARGYSETTLGAMYAIIIKVAGAKSSLKFDANGGVYTGTGCSPEIGKPYGFKYDPNEIYREGYFFAGWFDAPTGGNRIYASSIADGKVKTLYAHWVKVFTGKVWTLKAASYAKGRLTVTGTGIKTKCDGYEFSISKDGINWITVSQAKNVKYFTGLAAGTYTVRVRAYRRDSAGKLVYGSYTTTKAIVK